IEPDDLHEQWRAAEQFDIGNQKPVDHRNAPQAQHADNQADQRSQNDGADRVGDGPAEPEPEQVAVLAEDREVPNVGHPAPCQLPRRNFNIAGRSRRVTKYSGLGKTLTYRMAARRRRSSLISPRPFRDRW